MNPLLSTDSYKVTHHVQLPPGTKHVYSYLESRGGSYLKTTFFGLQYIIKRHLEGRFVEMHHVRRAKDVMDRHLGPGLFNYDGWRYIAQELGGFLPLRIKAVPEGTTLPSRNVLMTVENTDPKVPWLTNWVETMLVQVWYPTTVCSQSRVLRELIDGFMHRTTGTTDGAEFKLHDFGFRGSTSVESAAIGGAAHLVNFRGSDTMVALELLEDYYGQRGDQPAGLSIPAAEHSTITSWGPLREHDAFRNMLDQFPTGLVAVVSDSYNIYDACRAWGGVLKDRVLQRDGVLVVRPDSGDPMHTVMGILHILEEGFGSTRNALGFRVLDPHVRIIQGDGVNATQIREIYRRMEQECWSAENLAFGMGGALLQNLNRDTMQFAMKCSEVRGTYGVRDVWKNPIGYPMKASKRGRLKLVRHDDAYVTVGEDDERPDILETVFLDGESLVFDDLAHITARTRWPLTAGS